LIIPLKQINLIFLLIIFFQSSNNFASNIVDCTSTISKLILSEFTDQKTLEAVNKIVSEILPRIFAKLPRPVKITHSSDSIIFPKVKNSKQLLINFNNAKSPPLITSTKYEKVLTLDVDENSINIQNAIMRFLIGTKFHPQSYQTAMEIDQIRTIDHENDPIALIQKIADSIEAGTSSPISHFYFLSARQIGRPEIDLFNENGVINSDYFAYVLKIMDSTILAHQQVLICAGEGESVEQIKKIISNRFPEKSIGHISNNMGPVLRKKAIRNFQRGEFDIFLYDHFNDEEKIRSNIDLFINLNQGQFSLQFLKQVWELLVIEEGKESIDVITLVSHHKSVINTNLKLTGMAANNLFNPNKKIFFNPLDSNVKLLLSELGKLDQLPTSQIRLQELGQKSHLYLKRVANFNSLDKIISKKDKRKFNTLRDRALAFVGNPNDPELFKEALDLMNYNVFREEMTKFPNLYLKLINSSPVTNDKGIYTLTLEKILAYLEMNHLNRFIVANAETEEERQLYDEYFKIKDHVKFQNLLKKFSEIYALYLLEVQKEIQIPTEIDESLFLKKEHDGILKYFGRLKIFLSKNNYANLPRQSMPKHLLKNKEAMSEEEKEELKIGNLLVKWRTRQAFLDYIKENDPRMFELFINSNIQKKSNEEINLNLAIYLINFLKSNHYQFRPRTTFNSQLKSLDKNHPQVIEAEKEKEFAIKINKRLHNLAFLELLKTDPKSYEFMMKFF
jgi:hypothetical protein